MPRVPPLLYVSSMLSVPLNRDLKFATEKDLKLPLKKTNNGQQGYSFRGAKSWNGLSAGAK